MSFGPMQVIINPRAGRGAVERGWPAVKQILDGAQFDYDVTITERPGHGTQAARDAIEKGRTFVVAIGGDGTVHEVVNGMMGSDGPLDKDAVLGVVAAGSGCDFVKTFGLPQDPAEAARHLIGDNLWGRIDIGRVRYTDLDGKDATRWFANIAEVGLGAQVVASAAKLPRWLGGSVYRIAAIKEIARHHPFEASLKMHGRKARGVRVDTPLEETGYDGYLSLVVVANCQFFGGGMKVAPRAIPGDGMLDVQIFTGTRGEAVKSMQKIGKGTHVPSSKTLEYLATTATIEGREPILIEADGEVIGTTPATFDVIPDAIQMKV